MKLKPKFVNFLKTDTSYEKKVVGLHFKNFFYMMYEITPTHSRSKSQQRIVFEKFPVVHLRELLLIQLTRVTSRLASARASLL
jgi:hypothetical protein